MKKINLKNYSDKKTIIKKIVFVDGVARSGKLLTASLISSFKKMEILEFGENFEHFMSALNLKKCSKDFAKNFLTNYLNQVIYNKMISRNVNFRPNDITGLKNFYNPNIYKNRLNKPDGDIVLKNIKRIDPILPFVTHDIMSYYDAFKKLNLKIKFVEIYRNPFDLTYSWYKRNLAKNLESSPRSFTLKVKHNNKNYPWKLNSLPKNWSKLNDQEKCATYVINQTLRSVKQQRKIKNKLFLYTTTYRDITENTYSELKKIAKFLKTKLSNKTKKIIKQKKCPNFNLTRHLEKKKSFLRKSLSKEIFQKLLNLETEYNNNIYNLK